MQSSEATSDEVVKAELFGPRHLDSAIHWRAHRDHGDRISDIVSRHRLNEHRCQPNSSALGGGVGDALDELEELRRVDDRVGDR